MALNLKICGGTHDISPNTDSGGDTIAMISG